jgi:general transcription factor 3C polypeptide 3 (transcription factor C subunit 4)
MLTCCGIAQRSPKKQEIFAQYVYPHSTPRPHFLHQARNSLLSILKRFPHDLIVLSELRPILIDLSDLSLCTSLYQASFEHYQTAYPSGSPPPESRAQCFGLLDLLADLYNAPALAAHDRAVTNIRRGCRWQQGYAAQKVWDVCEDDHEYEVVPVGVLRMGNVQSGGFALDVNAGQSDEVCLFSHQA